MEKQQQNTQNNLVVKIQKQVFGDLFGGPKILPTRYIINFQKGATLAYCLALMKYYNNFSLGCQLYAAIHGSYGLIWLLKDFTYPDKSWSHKATFGSLLLVQSGLLAYWALPWMLASGNGIQNPSNLRICSIIFTYVLGVVIMMVSDAQKYYTLQYKKGLIDQGMFKYTRNPNYLGEIMVYLSFAMIVGNPIAYCIPLSVWVTIFAMNMYCKDLSLKMKQGWIEYSKRSYILFPKINGSGKLSLLVYVMGILAGYDLYQGNGGVNKVLNFIVSFIKK